MSRTANQVLEDVRQLSRHQQRLIGQKLLDEGKSESRSKVKTTKGEES